MKSLFITEDGRVSASDPVTATEFINMTTAATLNMFNNILKQVPEEDAAKVKGDLFDMYNQGASALLKVFAPEFEVHPDLTEQAIMEMENEILDRKVKELEGTEPIDDEDEFDADFAEENTIHVEPTDIPVEQDNVTAFPVKE
jgi:hypothetical protein